MQEDIVQECRKHGMVVTAYSPLGSDGAPLIEDSVVKKLAEKYSVAPSNILISLQANRPGVNGKLLGHRKPACCSLTVPSDPQVCHPKQDR